MSTNLIGSIAAVNAGAVVAARTYTGQHTATPTPAVPPEVPAADPSARSDGTIYHPATDPFFVAARPNATPVQTDAQEMIAQPVLDPEPDQLDDSSHWGTIVLLGALLIAVTVIVVLAAVKNRPRNL